MEDPPSSLKFICKHFYRKQQLRHVMSMIVPDPIEKGAFLYKNYNRNDGLIFTPESPELYSLKPGACEYLLKWKWASQLSCDFVGELTEGSSLPSQDPQFLEYDMCFAMRNESIPYRRIRLAYNHVLREFYTRSPAAVNGPVVLECLYDGRKLRNWDVFCVRVDKSHANSFKTIANTIENIMEDITVEDLAHVCEYSSASPSSSVAGQQQQQQQGEVFYSDELDTAFQSTVERQGHLAYYRMKQWQVDNKPVYVLQYSIMQNNAPSWKRYLALDECIGPNNETGQELVSLVEPAFEGDPRGARAHEEFVGCVFFARYGKWKIVRFGGRAELATGARLLEKLEQMNNIHFAVRDSSSAGTQSTVADQSAADANGGGAMRKRERSPPLPQQSHYTAGHYSHSHSSQHRDEAVQDVKRPRRE